MTEQTLELTTGGALLASGNGNWSRLPGTRRSASIDFITGHPGRDIT